MPEEKTCFIIMPVTTPERMIESYRDKAEHFKHVLDCLFKPAVQKAGYKPIPPTAKVADLIHPGIIKNLETSGIVLCDISCLNPNVFFELGIRTSLNKPVCVVKDELTTKVPFDAGIINHYEYQSSLEPWQLVSEIKKLSDHIIASVKRGQNQNTLWKYFGLKSTAVPYQGEQGVDSKIDYLTMQFESLRNSLDSVAQPSGKMIGIGLPTVEGFENISSTIYDNFPEGAKVSSMGVNYKNRCIDVHYIGDITKGKMLELEGIIKKLYNVNIRLIELPDPAAYFG